MKNQTTSSRRFLVQRALLLLPVLALAAFWALKVSGGTCQRCNYNPPVEDFNGDPIGSQIYGCCEMGIQNTPAYQACSTPNDSDWECLTQSTPTSVTSQNVEGNGDCQNCVWTPIGDPITLPITECWNDDTGCGGNG